MRFGSWTRSALFATTVSLAVGCTTVPQPGEGTTSGGGELPECADALATDGTYFLALSASLSGAKPFVFLTTVTSAPPGVELSLQPLLVADRVTPTGMPIVLVVEELGADGSFVTTPKDGAIPGDANPINGNDVAGSLSLVGVLCEELGCGGVSAELSNGGFTLTPDNSFFFMKRVDGMPYPEPPTVNCAGELGAPL